MAPLDLCVRPASEGVCVNDELITLIQTQLNGLWWVPASCIFPLVKTHTQNNHLKKKNLLPLCPLHSSSQRPNPSLPHREGFFVGTIFVLGQPLIFQLVLVPLSVCCWRPLPPSAWPSEPIGVKLPSRPPMALCVCVFLTLNWSVTCVSVLQQQRYPRVWLSLGWLRGCCSGSGPCSPGCAAWYASIRKDTCHCALFTRSINNSTGDALPSSRVVNISTTQYNWLLPAALMCLRVGCPMTDGSNPKPS